MTVQNFGTICQSLVEPSRHPVWEKELFRPYVNLIDLIPSNSVTDFTTFRNYCTPYALPIPIRQAQTVNAKGNLLVHMVLQVRLKREDWGSGKRLVLALSHKRRLFRYLCTSAAKKRSHAVQIRALRVANE